MYIPEFNRIEDRATAVAFMKENPFAIFVSSSEGGLIATHLPLLVKEVGGKIVLRGHFAKSNHHWSGVEQEESLVIFHGPHAYISPSLYEIRESVPTWNYATVHVYGRAKPIADMAEAERVLADLIAQFDPSYYRQWLTFSEEYRDKMLRRIVAFEFEARRVETKFKLGQNRTQAEQDNLIQSLQSSADTAVAGLAALMRQQKLGSS